MVLITDCIACQHGDHDHHHEVIQAVPDGVMGGVKCGCNGECRERANVRNCPLCEGKGCEECDGTGQRVRTHLDAGDGITMHVSGSAPLSPETAEALRTLARLAAAAFDEQHPASPAASAPTQQSTSDIRKEPS